MRQDTIAAVGARAVRRWWGNGSKDAPITHHPAAGGRRGPGAAGGRQGPGAAGGQASVEFLAVLPLLIAVALVCAQLLAVGYSSVLAGSAAEAAALALAGGGDPNDAARAALPGWSRARASVVVSGGDVRVKLRPPALLRPLSRELEVSAAASVNPP